MTTQRRTNAGASVRSPLDVMTTNGGRGPLARHLLVKDVDGFEGQVAERPEEVVGNTGIGLVDLVDDHDGAVGEDDGTVRPWAATIAAARSGARAHHSTPGRR